MSRLARAVLGFSVAALVILGVWGGWKALSRRHESQARPSVRLRPVMEPASEATGFARADGPRPFDFPADYGPHPDFQTEWWYYTGNLATDTGRRFGYQLTFFRRALAPPTERKERASEWAAEQVYMAHFALTDMAGEGHRAFERFSRGAAGLAGATSPPYQVWLEDWRVEQVADDPGDIHMYATQDDITIDLRLIDRRGPILQGDRGYSRKGPDPGNASYYYSQTRLETMGTVHIAGQSHPVEGWSWMDHEYSTSALAPDQVGWDWFALQLEDGSDLMVFQIRKVDGTIDAFSSGTLVLPSGETRHLSFDDFEIDLGSTWRSPRTAASYPSRWTVYVPGAALTLEIEPYLEDQELDVSYTYWEGAVRVEGRRNEERVVGEGYVEMTGYAESLQEQF
jgi:predicted secreted hydrolase